MKALTLWQPWASLVALGVKTIETRGWDTSHRGPLAIHASVSVGASLIRGASLPVGKFTIARDDPRGSKPAYLLRGPNIWPYRLPLGAVVATCELSDVVPMVDEMPAQDTWNKPWSCITCDPWPILNTWPGFGSADGRSISDQAPFGDFSPARFAWVLENIRPVSPEIPAVGHQGLWNWEAA